MIMRVASVTLSQYVICKNYGLWGAERASLNKWSIGDYLLFKVNESILGIAIVTGKPFEDNLMFWDNGLYPYRIPIEIQKEYSEEDSIELYNLFKKIMIAEYGTYYGWVILNKHPLNEIIANEIYKYKHVE